MSHSGIRFCVLFGGVWLSLVPNALHFIDKYNQVPRILNPMVLAIEGIDRIARDPFIFKYIEDCFGGINSLKKSALPNTIL